MFIPLNMDLLIQTEEFKFILALAVRVPRQKTINFKFTFYVSLTRFHLFDLPPSQIY